ncbi:hypothetical protein CQW23_26530 [Capsicum baccatum]|uniref:Uncharacterized protein n=1 Tax=Capsicum baccatum TaxID=33114 RepID=A0A2G2VP23_CAPBA|nr:hypothetical protein CQW23_26530 [Capsicum baccatum]
MVYLILNDDSAVVLLNKILVLFFSAIDKLSNATDEPSIEIDNPCDATDEPSHATDEPSDATDEPSDIVHLWLVSTNRELKMTFFLTLRSVQTLSDPKVIDRIKKELFGATTITKKIILEGGFVVVDDGSGSGAAVGANDVSLTVFETTNHYDYDHTGYTNFATSSECSACKCQDLDYSLSITTYTEYLRDGLQIPNDGLDTVLLRKRYATLLWKYGETKAQKPYSGNIKDPRRSKPNSIAPDEEQLIHIEYIFIA